MTAEDINIGWGALLETLEMMCVLNSIDRIILTHFLSPGSLHLFTYVLSAICLTSQMPSKPHVCAH